MCAFLGVASSASAQTLSGDLLAQRLVDPIAALRPLPAGVRVVMPSSHDRTGGNLDGGGSTGPLTATGTIPPTYIRREAGGYVLMEFDRPGCLVRTYMSGGTVPPGDTGGFGRLQLFFDGEQTPRFDESAADLFAGKDPRYPRPLTEYWSTSSGGNVAYVPFCFARSLKVRTTALPGDGLGYWQANVLLAPPGTPVRTYDPHASLAATAAALSRAGGAPATPPDAMAEGSRVMRLRGAGTVRFLRFTVAPFDLATLRDLSLVVRADRAARPQVDVPLADMFGDGLEVRPVSAKAFGMDPAGGTGYLALPVPFTHGVALQVVARRGARVRMEAWRGPRVRGAGTLFGEHHLERAAEGSDTRVLDATGSGRLASIVTDDLDGGPASGIPPVTQRFLEGDERVEIDGSRSPTFYGTGHEESNNGGFYYGYGAFTGKLGGAGVLGSTPEGDGTQNQYRVFADDGPRWSSAIAYGQEHGGGDEQPDLVALTTFSYRGPATLRAGDAPVLPAGGRADPLTAYFEGEHDGNSTQSTVIAGGSVYPAPAASQSPEGVSARGIRFAAPVSVTLRVARRNAGVVLRGLFDEAPPLVPLAVSVDGRPAGVWTSPTQVPNPSKRWLEDDYDLPPRLTARKRRIRVTLAPAIAGAEADLFGIRALSRLPS